MQDRPPQNANDVPRSSPPRNVRFAAVRSATFRFAGPARFELIRLAHGMHAGTPPWLRMRTTAGLAAVILGLADGRSTNANTPKASPRRAVKTPGEVEGS
jgi:hypothetical protein